MNYSTEIIHDITPPDYKAMMESFTIANWCGMPYKINPRKMV